MNHSNMKVPDRIEEKPPHSRIFVVCSRHVRAEDLRTRFGKFGTIEDIYVPKDRATGESKGFAYIKYTKTSSAAVAIQELHMKVIEGDNKPMKVMLAINKHGGPTQNDNEDRYKRLFIIVEKDAAENEIRNHFSKFGQVESVHCVRDKSTDICKGFAYVVYKTFHGAAVAYEECDRVYKPMFATPRTDLKRSRNSQEDISNPRSYFSEKYNQTRYENSKPFMSDNGQDYKAVVVKCSPPVPQKYIERLFNVIPGMQRCQYSLDSYDGVSTAVITYAEAKYAAFALERLNNFEFPSGEVLSIKPDNNTLAEAASAITSMVNSFKHAVDSGAPDLIQLADAIAQASTLIKVATNASVSVKKDNQDLDFCSVNLPPKKDLANSNSIVAQRLFIICKPQPPPTHILRDIFCRFGDMIDVSTFPNKTFGFVKYASANAARDAIQTLHGATVCGIKLKVLEADEKPNRDENSKTHDKTEISDPMNHKRKRLDSANCSDSS